MNKERERILIIDDDEGTCRTLSLIFKQKGYETEAAATGQEAIDTAREQFFNLALVDIRLPDVEGIELLGTLKQIHPDIEVIMTTAFASLETALRALNEGASGYITKPLNLNDVLATVQGALEKQRLVIENRRLYREAQRELAERMRAEEEIRQRTAQLEALRQVALDITAELDAETLLHSIVSEAVGLLRGTAGTISLHLPDQDVLKGVVAVGSTVAPTGNILRKGEGLAGEIWNTGKPLIVNHYQRWKGRVIAPPVGRDRVADAAIVGVPVRWGGEFLGVLHVEDAPSRTFSSADAELLELFAVQAAIAIRNARVFEAEQRQRQEAETLRIAAMAMTTALDRDEVIERILAQLQEVVPYTSASVQLFVEDRMDMEIVGGRGFPEGSDMLGISFSVGGNNPNSEVVLRNAPVIVQDAPAAYEGFRQLPHAQAGIRAWLGVPMLIGEQLIGMIALDKQEPGFYTPEHARLAEAFAAQAAFAIENSRLFHAEREQAELAEALKEAAAALSSTLDLDRVLDRILEQVERVVTGDDFTIMLVEDDEIRTVRHRRQSNSEPVNPGIYARLSATEHPILLRMVQTGEPVFISDTASNPHWMSLDGKEGLTLQRSYVGAPIRVKDLTVGFLNVSSSEPGRFGPDTARRLQAFADHAAAALENAQLYQALRTHAEGLEDRVQERTAQLEAQHAWQEAILQSTSNGIIVADTKGKILQANPVAKKWLQRALLPEDSAQLRKAIQQLAKRAQEHPEMMLELKGLDLELRAAPISNPYAGNATAVVAVHDVSHLKALDRMKTRFVSNVSHELRTPVTTIKLYASLLQRSPPEKWKDYVDALAQEADRQAQLVESILHVSKIDAGRLELDLREVSLNELVETVVFSHQFLAERKDLILRYQGTAPEPLVLVDSRQMMQVLNNLLENSIRYTPQGGTVVISTGTNQEDGRIWATVLVEDSGVGIPEVELPHIFERFFRGEEPREMQISGTGLGLAIAKEIIELHGGQIKVESQVGQGSTFFVSLPLVQPHPHSQR